MSRHVRATVAVAVLSLAVLGPPVQAQGNSSTQELADLRARAEAGEAQAQASLGWKYANGDGVPQDAAEAVRWYRLAAEQGHAQAQAALAGAYALGQGVPQDEVEALTWWRQAAEQGHAAAQTVLGHTYLLGQGVPQDEAEAVDLVPPRRRAGCRRCPVQPRVCSYANGEGVPQDAAEAMTVVFACPPSRTTPAPITTSGLRTPTVRAYRKTTLPHTCG